MVVLKMKMMMMVITIIIIIIITVKQLRNIYSCMIGVELDPMNVCPRVPHAD
jgi:hypothetical protein